MTPQKFEIYFEDDIAQIKCGKRIVEAEIGLKWVYLTLPFASRRVRVSRERFYSLAPRAVQKEA